MFPPGSRSRFFLLTFFLTAVIVVAITFVNRQYFFHAEAYETGDQAANSLDVLRCEKFQDYLGAYSRWGFHHPGPFLFYCYAAGETLFWRWFHLTLTPINAQVLSVLCLTAGFFAVGVGIASRWVRSAFFVPVALLLAALHYTAVHLQMCMLDTWPPYVTPLPYFCLLVAAASVAAGQGEDLPWLVLAGSVLIHIHVANPLFVLPLFALAYAGLLWTSRREAAGGAARVPAVRPWRRYPRAHGVAGVLAGIFVLPIVIDLCHGANSNFALILHHLRTHQGERYPYMDAVYYLMRFGAYKPAVVGDVKVFGGTTLATLSHFNGTHLKMLFLWSAALLSPLLALGLRSGLKPLAGAAQEEIPEEMDRARWRFLVWLLVCIALCTGLALFWAHIQDGEMLYYNAWYIYSLYGVILIVAAVALSDMLERVARRFRRPGLLTGSIASVFVVMALAVFVEPGKPEKNHAYLGNFDSTRALARSVLTSLAGHPEAPRTKFIVIPDDSALGAAPGVGILLKRHGYDFKVVPQRKFMLGFENSLPDSWLDSGLSPGNTVPAMETWWLVRHAPGVVPAKPLIDNYELKTGNLVVDPARASAIVFAGPARNSQTSALLGFLEAAPEATGTWTIDYAGRLDFDTLPVPPEAQVEVAFDFWPPLVHEPLHPTQRLEIRYNHTALGTITVGAATPPASLRTLIPASLWNNRPSGVLSLGFPDAVAPADFAPGKRGDTRRLGFAARKITFRLVDPAVPVAASAP